MNHCLIQAVIKTKPQMRYTKENQIPIAEMIVVFKGLRNEDPTNELKILGWGTIAQEMSDQLKEGQNVVVEGRLRMNTITRKDGTKEKQAELTASKIHHITLSGNSSNLNTQDNAQINDNGPAENSDGDINPGNKDWNTSPLVPEVDEIPF